MSNKTVTTNWSELNPRDYLQKYYADVGPENFALLRFAVQTFSTVLPEGILLDFGGGPTIYPLIAAANKVREIHFCDYSDTNLDEVHQWLQGSLSAFDWHEFVKVTLGLEGNHNYTVQAVQQREMEIRRRVTQVFKCDARRTPPIDEPQAYDILITNFCAESATNDWIEWRQFFRNIVSLLKPNGTLLLSAIKGATCITIGEKTFHVVSLKENDIKEALVEEGFDPQSIVIESIPADHLSREYEGLILVTAKKI